jgi:hypothetical protein
LPAVRVAGETGMKRGRDSISAERRASLSGGLGKRERRRARHYGRAKYRDESARAVRLKSAYVGLSI